MPADSATPATGQPPHDEPINILIVDDRPDKLLALETILSELNQDIVTATSGKEALRCLLREDFAVILLDVNMPEMDGFETAALIRQRPRSEKTPIIFISAINDTETHISRGYSLGAVDYILTPIIPEILRAKVAVFVDLFRKTKQIERQATQTAQFIREQAAREESEAARERLAFLAEAGYALFSLEPREIIESLAHLLVPKLGDYCRIDILDESHETLWMKPSIAHHDSDLERALQTANIPCPGESCLSTIAAQVHKSARSRIDPITGDALLRDLAGSEEQFRIFREMGVISSLVLPIIQRSKSIGIISLLRSQGRYSEADLSLAEAFAERVALALENANLYKATQQARLEAERASFEKDRFLAMLSHELRTPLTPVLASVIALEDEVLSDEARVSVEMIRRNVELEARLIDDLLDLTRIAEGKLQINPEVIDAHALLNNVIEICHPEILTKTLRLQTAFSATRSHLSGDPARFQQIVWNLLRNAVKFTPAGGEITLSTRDKEEQIEIEIRDTGIGIDADVLPKIFKAFEQGKQFRQGGLGLGLAITKALVGLHRGEIIAESEGKDRGSKFTLRFPSTTLPLPKPTQRFPLETKTGASNLRILLVEDHEDTNRSLTNLLHRRGYQVESTSSLKEALELAKNGHFQVVISDIGLPDGSGLDVIKKGFPENSPVLGIALSGYGMETDIKNSYTAGFHHHLIKPVDLNQLYEIIQRGTASLRLDDK